MIGTERDWDEAGADEEEPEAVTFGICWAVYRLFLRAGTTASLSRCFDVNGA